MKLRNGFVSNSSSCSFIIEKKHGHLILSDFQIQLIRDYYYIAKKFKLGPSYCLDNGWEITENEKEINCFTVMANFSLASYVFNIANVSNLNVKNYTSDNYGNFGNEAMAEREFYGYDNDARLNKVFEEIDKMIKTKKHKPNPICLKRCEYYGCANWKQSGNCLFHSPRCYKREKECPYKLELLVNKK